MAPAMAARRGLQTPQAMTTCSTAITPRAVTTARMRGRPNRGRDTSSPTTSVSAITVSTPFACARSRMIVPARTESTTDTLGV